MQEYMRQTRQTSPLDENKNSFWGFIGEEEVSISWKMEILFLRELYTSVLIGSYSFY